MKILQLEESIHHEEYDIWHLRQQDAILHYLRQSGESSLLHCEDELYRKQRDASRDSLVDLPTHHTFVTHIPKERQQKQEHFLRPLAFQYSSQSQTPLPQSHDGYDVKDVK